jgi:hypothetical protein
MAAGCHVGPTALSADGSQGSIEDSRLFDREADLRAASVAEAPSKCKSLCNPAEESQRDSTVRRAHVSQTNPEFRVLPGLLLLLVVAGFYWYCSPFSAPHAAPPISEGLESSQAWADLPLPIIALLIVGGYAIAILAMIYLPMYIGAEASMWVMLTALVLMVTRKWWSQQLMNLLTLNRLSALGTVCLFYPLLQTLFGTSRVEEADHSAPYAKNQPQAKLAKVSSFERLVVDGPASKTSCEAFTGADQRPTKIVEKATSSSAPRQDASLQSRFAPLTSGFAEACGRFAESASDSPSSRPSTEGSRVLIHLYDVTRDARIEKVNSLLAPRLCPLKLGGFFHAGVEVNGREWSFGCSAWGSGMPFRFMSWV